MFWLILGVIVLLIGELIVALFFTNYANQVPKKLGYLGIYILPVIGILLVSLWGLQSNYFVDLPQALGVAYIFSVGALIVNYLGVGI